MYAEPRSVWINGANPPSLTLACSNTLIAPLAVSVGVIQDVPDSIWRADYGPAHGPAGVGNRARKPVVPAAKSADRRLLNVVRCNGDLRSQCAGYQCKRCCKSHDAVQ